MTRPHTHRGVRLSIDTTSTRPDSVPVSPSPTSAAQGRSSWRARFDPRMLVFAVVAAILLYEIAVPLAILVWGSVSSARPGQAEFFSLSSATLDNFTRAFEGGRMLGVLADTATFAGGTTVLSFALGTFLAWVVERTNTPLRRFITMLLVLRLILPGILTTIAWIFLASPRIGTLNLWVQTLFGLEEPPFDVYTMS